MRSACFPCGIVLILLAFSAPPAQAGPEGFRAAARLNAALEGTLDSDMGEAGALKCTDPCSPVALRSSRSDEYRQRVARERLLAARELLTAAPPN